MTAVVPFSRRGRPVYGARLGVIMLDTRFRRLPGDIGHAASFPFPVHYAVAKSLADGAKIKPSEETIEVFLSAVNYLVGLGVDGIVTSCGFLSIIQPQLQALSPVPIATSSLLQIPLIERTLPKNSRVGVVTANKAALTEAHLAGAGVTTTPPVAGMPEDGVFIRHLLQGKDDLGAVAQQAEVLDCVGRFLAGNPDIGALLLECTNLAPHSSAIEERFGVPVFDIMTLIHWFHSGLQPRSYG